jgi:hypothetical protein
MTYLLFVSLCYGVMALTSSEAFQSAQPMRIPVSSTSSSSSSSSQAPRRQLERQRLTQTPPLTLFNTHHLEGIGSVILADQKQEALSKQIANLEIAMVEQKEGVPVDVQKKPDFRQERQELEGELFRLQAQFESARQELDSAREHEAQSVSAVETEARRKIRIARSEGREVSERVRVDMTKRLSTKEQEIKLAKASLAEKSYLLDKWSAERVSIKMLMVQAWNILKSRSNVQKEKMKKKAAEDSARNKAAINSEWSTTRESAKILSVNMFRLITSFVKAILYCAPFWGSSALVASGAVLDLFGGKKK